MAEDDLEFKILKLLQEGKINCEEAKQLLHPEKTSEQRVEQKPKPHEEPLQEKSLEEKPEEVYIRQVKPKGNIIWPRALLKYFLFGIEGIALIAFTINFRNHLREYLIHRTKYQVAKYYLTHNTVDGIKGKIPFIKLGEGALPGTYISAKVWGREENIGLYSTNEDQEWEVFLSTYNYDHGKKYVKEETRNLGLLGGLGLASLIAGFFTRKIRYKRKDMEKIII